MNATYDLILNEFAGKVHLGYGPRECSYNLWEGDFLRGFYIDEVQANLSSQTLRVVWKEIYAFAPNREMVHQIPFPFPRGTEVTNGTSYVLDGMHPAYGITWFRAFCMIPVEPNADGSPNEIGGEFWRKALDGMLHIAAYMYLLPNVLRAEIHKTMPFNKGAFRHPIFTDVTATETEIICNAVAGARPFTYTLGETTLPEDENGQAVFTELAAGEHTVSVTDALENSREIKVVIPEPEIVE